MAVRKCSKCERDFLCISEKGGCWCENLNVSSETLKILSECFSSCLCPVCLSAYSKTEEQTEKLINN
jgi:hypothetical protein